MAFISGTFLSTTLSPLPGSVTPLLLPSQPCVPEGKADDLQQIQYFGELVYYPTAFFTKTSILCLIARVFAPQRKAVLLIRLIICLMLLYYLPAFFVKLFRCNPIHKAWDVKVPGKCVTTESSIFLAVSVLIAGDQVDM